MRDLVRLGPAALACLGVLVAGALATWVGGTLAALWVAGRVQVASESFGLAVLALIASAAVILATALRGLGALTRAYQRRRVARGLEDTGGFPLEVTMVCTAGLAAVALAVWFFGFAGSPLPSG